MKDLIKIAFFCYAPFLAGCTSMHYGGMDSARANTQEIALLIQSINQSTATFQKQRDAIAVSSKIQRDSLEALAVRYENDAYRASAAWDVAGQPERKHTFDTLRYESNQLLTRIEAQRARELKQAQELRETRSGVLFQSAKISESAVGLIQLSEPPSQGEKANFYFEYLKKVRDLIKADSDAENVAPKESRQSSGGKP